jgi:hypothetical protein
MVERHVRWFLRLVRSCRRVDSCSDR